MRAGELNAKGCLNLVGGFWRQVLRDLHGESDEHRADAEAFLADDARFLGWCHIGGINLDPDALREILRGGVLPRGASAALFGQ